MKIFYFVVYNYFCIIDIFENYNSERSLDSSYIFKSISCYSSCDYLIVLIDNFFEYFKEENFVFLFTS